MQTKPRRTTLDRMTVAGIAVRTSNATEKDPTKARIGRHWKRFTGERLEQRMADVRVASDVVAVYYDYESDASGQYSLLIGYPVHGESTLPDIDIGTHAVISVSDLETDDFPMQGESAIVSVVSDPGDYLVFEARGEMPEALIECWRSVWDYFKTSKEMRTFETDFEFHRPEGVEVYVGVRGG